MNTRKPHGTVCCELSIVAEISELVISPLFPSLAVEQPFLPIGEFYAWHPLARGYAVLVSLDWLLEVMRAPVDENVEFNDATGKRR